jgi:hypothetical protein
MRRPIWMILAVLFVAIGVPDSHADSFTPIFTCIPCASTPTAPDVSFPPPLTIDVTWENTLFDFSLTSGQPTDFYTWQGFTPPGFSQSGFASFTIIANGTPSVIDAPFLFQLDDNNNCLNCKLIDSGSLRFDPALAPSVPEPSSVVLMLAGIGFLLMVMPKRLAHDHHYVPDFLENCPVELEPSMKKMPLILLHRYMEKIMPTLPLVLSGIAVAVTGLYEPEFANAQTTTKPYYVGTCKPGKADFTTIQQAVTAVPPGSTINVCPGNYPEQVVIQQPLTVQGVQSGNNSSIVITAPPAPIVSFQSQLLVGAVAAQLAVLNTSGPVNISQLTVDGGGFFVAGANIAGIAYESSSGTLTQVSQLLQSTNAVSFPGILVLNDSGISQTFSMKDSLVQGAQSEGVFILGQAINLDIENSYFFMSAPGFGILAQNTSGGTISGNTIDLPNGAGHGISVLSNSSPITVNGNSTANGSFGIEIDSLSTTSLIKNTLSNSATGIVFAGTADSTIQGNQIVSSLRTGIDLLCFNVPSISGNFFLGEAKGITNIPMGVSLQKKGGTFVNVASIETICNH